MFNLLTRYNSNTNTFHIKFFYEEKIFYIKYLNLILINELIH